MTSKWTSPAENTSTAAAGLSEQFVVLLLYGKNSFGDKIYSYVKITLQNLQNLKTAIRGGSGFNPSDFGEVIAAGRGMPSDETRREIASMYQVLDNTKPAAPAATAAVPEEKKAWDEY